MSEIVLLTFISNCTINNKNNCQIFVGDSTEQWDKDSKELRDWITLMEKDKNAQTITLQHNLRNTEYIVNASNAVSDNLSDPKDETDLTKMKKNMIGNPNYYFSNEHHFDPWILIQAVIEKEFSSNKEPVVVLTGNRGDEISNWLKRNLNRNVIFLPQKKLDDSTLQEINEFLNEPTGVLVTCESTFHGAQARNIIIMLENPQIPSIRNVILRTTSFAYILDNRNVNKGAVIVPGLEIDDTLPHYIKHSASYYENNENLPEHVIAEAVINEHYNDNLRNNVFIITNKEEEMFSHLNKVFGDKHKIIHCKNTQDIEKTNKIAKSIIVYPESYPFAYYHIKKGQDIIMFPLQYDMGFDNRDAFELKYRNMILSVRPEFALVIDGDCSMYAPCIEWKEFKIDSINLQPIQGQHNELRNKPISREEKERLQQIIEQLEQQLAQIEANKQKPDNPEES